VITATHVAVGKEKHMFKRFLPIAGVCGVLSIVLAGTAAAGGGGGYGGPGHLRFSDTTAYATFSDTNSGYSTSVYLDRGQLSFKPKRTSGGPVVQKNGTVLNVNEYSATASEYGCWVIPDSAFVVAGDLSSASVNVHATADMQCPGGFVSGATGGKPGLQSSIGYGGGGGVPPTQITDIVVSLAWTGNGGLWKNTNSGTSKCGSYKATFHSTFDYEYAAATGTIGDQSGSSDPFGQIGQSSQDSNSNSIPSGACNPFGF
jgi:hypothetical protein